MSQYRERVADAGGPGDRTSNGDLQALFDVAPEEFVAARNELAKKLSAAGKRAAASEIKGIARPTVPVWAINRIARRFPEKVAALLDSGQRLRRMQSRALRSGSAGADELRAVARDERQAIGDLVKAAGSALTASNRAESSGLLGRIESTLHAIAIGDDLERELLRKGELRREAQAVGFPAITTRAADAQPPRVERPSPKRAARDAKAALLAHRSAERDVRTLSKSLRAAEARTAKLQARAQRAEREAAEARARLATAEAETAETRRELAEGQQRLQQASARLSAARAAAK
jgi:chromosome segregation ATPase